VSRIYTGTDFIVTEFNPVVGVKNPFDAVERILGSVLGTQVNDRLGTDIFEKTEHFAQ
jgi:hypothetical protein